MYVSLAEWGGSSAASHLPVAAWPAGAIVGDGLCGEQSRAGEGQRPLNCQSPVELHTKAREDFTITEKAQKHELCIGVPITCLLTMG